MNYIRTRVAGLLLVLASGLCLSGCAFLRGYASARSSDLERHHELAVEAAGALRFVFDDFGGLDTDTLESHALPWKLVSAALVMAARAAEPDTELEAEEILRQRMQSFGFVYPQAIANWPQQTQPRFERPLGLVAGTLRRKVPRIQLEVVNLGCAACHAGVTYDRQGHPRQEVWLGLPNTSIDLEAYTSAVYRDLLLALEDQTALERTLLELYPQVDPIELATLRRFALPRTARRLQQLARTIDRPTPFLNGSPGVTNGVAALKRQLGLIPDDRLAEEHGFTSIPDLGERHLRRSMLYDGAYRPPTAGQYDTAEPLVTDLEPGHRRDLARIVAFFTVPTMGIAPAAVDGAVPAVEEVLSFLRHYQPPAFPAPIDDRLAARGSEVYAAHCADCHGSYDDRRPRRLESFPDRLSAQAEMGTDPHRWQAMDAELTRAIDGSQHGHRLDANSTGGYVATPLSGLWATAPYLHNGSVPTLWHLMHPEERPDRFYVGGHSLDLERLGIACSPDSDGVCAYPEDVSPWSRPQLYDTAQPGRDNGGHEREFQDLGPADKRALLEFLKQL